MAEIEDNDVEIPVTESIADEEEGKSRRGILKQIALTAVALAAMKFTSAKASAQVQEERRPAPTDKPPTEQQILGDLRKNGVTNLEGLAKRIVAESASGRPVTWVVWRRGKYVIVGTG